MTRFHSKLCWALFIAVLIHSAPTIAAAQQGAFQVQIVADDMCCKGCAQKIAAQLYAAPGVTSVEADVPNRLVTVTAKPSPKLTLERIWSAVEKGNGGPSKLSTTQATYVLTRAERLQPERRLPAGRYSLQVSAIQDNDNAQKIANQLYAVPGVETVSADVPQRTLFVQSTNGAVLSPWALATAAERADGTPIAVAGPYGLLTIERTAATDPATAGRSVYSRPQGGVR